MEAVEVLYAVYEFVDMELLQAVDPEMHGRLSAWQVSVDALATPTPTPA